VSGSAGGVSGQEKKNCGAARWIAAAFGVLVLQASGMERSALAASLLDGLVACWAGADGGAAGAEQRAGWRLADAAGRLQRERRRVAVRMRWSGLAWWL
jgi:hypothetical protein